MCITFKHCGSEHSTLKIIMQKTPFCFLLFLYTQLLEEICSRRCGLGVSSTIRLLIIYAPNDPSILTIGLFVPFSFYKMFPSEWVPGGKRIASVSSVLFQTLSPFSAYRFVNAALLVLSKGLTCGCPPQEHIIELRPGFRHQRILWECSSVPR